MKFINFIFVVCLLPFHSTFAEVIYEELNPKYETEFKLVSNKNYLKDFDAINPDNTINVVIEIPSGTNDKWEVSKKDGSIEWEFKKGKPRVVKYLPYVTNYGMIPKTLLNKDQGGDGDPLDVILLGPAYKRGSIVKAKVIGTMKMLDGGEIDDKILAISSDSIFNSKVNNVNDLDKNFAGVTEMLKIWFENYKGPGEIEVTGFENKEESLKIIRKSTL